MNSRMPGQGDENYGDTRFRRDTKDRVNTDIRLQGGNKIYSLR